jgi:hypothetical protein
MLRSAISHGYRSLNASSAASAANSLKENQMQTQNAAEATRAAEAEKLQAALETGKQEAHADTTAILDLCALTGRMDLAAAFIAAKKSPEEVRKELMAAKAANQPEVNTAVLPGGNQAADPQQGKAKPWGEILSALGVRKK